MDYTSNVQLLNHTYINEKHTKLGLPEKSTHYLHLQPVVFHRTGVALVNSLRKVLLDNVECYAVKNSLKLDHYEQTDSKGNLYIDPVYKDGYLVRLKNNYFQDYSRHDEYQQKSGYAKIIRVDNSGQTVYNGVEHTQILTEKLGYIPINSNLDYIVDNRRNKAISLDQLWLFIGECSQDRIENLDEIMPVFHKSGREHLAVDIERHMLVFYNDIDTDNRQYWYNITRQCKPSSYGKENAVQCDLDCNFLFPYNTLITYLKSGQKIKGYMRLEKGGGRAYAKWCPVICRYKFATESDLKGDKGSSQVNPELNVNVQQRLYLTYNDPLYNSVFINEPESIILTIESVQKLNAPNVLYRGIVEIQNWMYQFRNNLMNLFLQRADAVSLDNNSEPIKRERFDYPILILQLKDCNHNFISLLTDYLLRYLVEKAKSLGGNLDDKLEILKSWLEDTIIAYKKRHPLRQEAYLTLKYPTALLEQIKYSDLKTYFTEPLTLEKEKDVDQFNFCKIMYLTLSGLDFIDNNLEHLKNNIREKFLEATPSQFALNYRGQLANFDYNYLVKKNKIVTKYTESTTLGLPYISDQSNQGKPFQLTRQRFLSTLYFLSKYLNSNNSKSSLLIYTGNTSTLSSFNLIQELYPELKVVIFDCSEIKSTSTDKVKNSKYYDKFEEGFSLDSFEYHIFHSVLTPEIANSLKIQLKDSGLSLLFVSNLKSTVNKEKMQTEYKKSRGLPASSKLNKAQEQDLTKLYNRKRQQSVYNDNYNNYLVTLELNRSGLFVAASIDFMFPYQEYSDQLELKPKNVETGVVLSSQRLLKYNEYFKGEFNLTPYASGSNVTSQLIVTREDLSESLVTYDYLKYEEFYSYINNVYRRNMKFYAPKLPGLSKIDNQNNLSQKYDYLLELLILNQYVVNQFPDNLDYQTNPYRYISELFSKIENDKEMSTISWSS